VDLFEWQGKQLFREAGIPTPRGIVADDSAAALEAAERLGLPVALKAQVLTGGRGKAGGVRIVEDAAEVEPVAAELLGLTIRGHAVASLLVEEVVPLHNELYLAVTLDRGRRRPVLLISAEGGVDIEEVARTSPQALFRVPLDPLRDPDVAVAADAGEALAAVAEACKGGRAMTAALVELAGKVYALYRDRDATLVELNPLAVAGETPDRSGDHEIGDDSAGGEAVDDSAGDRERGGEPSTVGRIAGTGTRLLALDSKVTIDDDALFRQQDLQKWRAGGDERERRAHEAGVTYVTLDGDVGVIGNGAGLVMSTLDLIAAAGGRPANFCDIGGGARADQIAAALEIITADARVKALLVSVFGGITRGDEVARGVITGLDRVPSELPIVVRIDGNNAAEGRALLAAERPDLIVVETPWEAVRRVVALAAGACET